jgi:putative addiction module component (TIGR02574 family)
MTVARLKRQALALAPGQRIRLVQDIWDSLLDEPNAVRIPARHSRLIDQRVAEHEADPQSAIPLGQAKIQIRKHLARRRAK